MLKISVLCRQERDAKVDPLWGILWNTDMLGWFPYRPMWRRFWEG